MGNVTTTATHLFHLLRPHHPTPPLRTNRNAARHAGHRWWASRLEPWTWRVACLPHSTILLIIAANSASVDLRMWWPAAPTFLLRHHAPFRAPPGTFLRTAWADHSTPDHTAFLSTLSTSAAPASFCPSVAIAATPLHLPLPHSRHRTGTRTWCPWAGSQSRAILWTGDTYHTSGAICGTRCWTW